MTEPHILLVIYNGGVNQLSTKKRIYLELLAYCYVA